MAQTELDLDPSVHFGHEIPESSITLERINTQIPPDVLMDLKNHSFQKLRVFFFGAEGTAERIVSPTMFRGHVVEFIRGKMLVNFH